MRKKRTGFILICMLLLAAGCGSKEAGMGTKTGEGQSQQGDAGEGQSQQNDAQEQSGQGQQEQNNVQNDVSQGGNAGGQDVTGVSESSPEDSAVSGKNAAEDDDRKTVSIMGDSISTFDEWILEGYYDYYPIDGDVLDVSQTWWKMVLEDMDFSLCVNASSSGSTCVGDSLGIDYPQHGCNDFRTSDLAGEDGRHPDIIIVYMGTNDCLNSVPLGDNDGTRPVEEGEIENFSDAYCLMLDKVIANYPGSQVFCCNLAPIGHWKDDAYVISPNGIGLTSADYSRQIETIATANGCPVIDLKNCGITADNMVEYMSDGVHLNPEGMKLIRDAVEDALLAFYPVQA